MTHGGYTCAGCGYTNEKVTYHMRILSCSNACAKRAWRDRRIKATRAWNREMKKV